MQHIILCVWFFETTALQVPIAIVFLHFCIRLDSDAPLSPSAQKKYLHPSLMHWGGIDPCPRMQPGVLHDT